MRTTVHLAAAQVLLLVLLLLAAGHNAAAGLKFIVMPVFGSPALDVMGVAGNLQSRGHSVTVLTSADSIDYIKSAASRHSSNSTAEAMEYVLFDNKYGIDKTIDKMMQQAGKAFKQKSKLGGFLARPCRGVLLDDKILQHLKSLEADAVAAIGLSFGSSGDGCTCVLAHALNLPIININGNPLLRGPPSVPQFGSGLTLDDLKTWKGWALNHLVWAAKAGERKAKRCDSVVEVILSSWLLEYPRPLAPNQVLVGPGSPRAAHPAISPPEIAEFVDGATQGVVLVAFGTTPQASITMNQTDFTELSAAFSSLGPVRVLWAMKEKSLPASMTLADLPLGENTKVVPWVDYNDVLGHPNLRVFMTHCGVHSMWEAAFHGVPVVAVPFQFEQAENAAKVVAGGSGVLCQQAPAYRSGKSENVHYTKEYVAELIRQ
eukprot:gene2757-3050_t